MYEEILKFLADGNTKTATADKFDLSLYKLNKILKESSQIREAEETKESLDLFKKEFLDCENKPSIYQLSYVMRVYYGYCINNKLEPVTVREFISYALCALKITPPGENYFRKCLYKSDIILLTSFKKNKNMLDYYAKYATNNYILRKILPSVEQDFDKDCLSLLFDNVTVSEFEAKWGSLRSLYYKDEIPELQKTQDVNVSEENETNSTETTKEKDDTSDTVKDDNVENSNTEQPVQQSAEVFNDASTYVEVPIRDKQFTNLKRLRKMFTIEEVFPETVNAVLCSGRHDIHTIVDDINASSIFNTLNDSQMQDGIWMEERALKWIDDHVKFDEHGNALQSINVYTTGYNPLNMTLVKCALQRKVNLTALYHIISSNSYWAQKIIDQFPVQKSVLTRYVGSGKYYVYGELKSNEIYRVVLNLEDVESAQFQFLFEDRDVAFMLMKHMNYEFIKHPFTVSVYKHNLKNSKLIYSCFNSGEEL